MGNVLSLTLGVIFAGLGLLWIANTLVAQNTSDAIYGVALLLLGGARIFWSIGRMRATNQLKARQLQAQHLGRDDASTQPPRQ